MLIIKLVLRFTGKIVMTKKVTRANFTNLSCYNPEAKTNDKEFESFIFLFFSRGFLCM